jgi:NADH:ubiquinone oxidoreductase subunit 4 (subunit M)
MNDFFFTCCKIISNNGFISAAMFLVVGVLYDRLHSREISTYGGVIIFSYRVAPRQQNQYKPLQ